MFLHNNHSRAELTALAKEFQLKIIVSDEIEDLFDLPSLYQAAHDALELMTYGQFSCGNVCSVSQLRTPLMLKRLEGNANIIPPKLRELAAHDRKKETQYCETLTHTLYAAVRSKKHAICFLRIATPYFTASNVSVRISAFLWMTLPPIRSF